MFWSSFVFLFVSCAAVNGAHIAWRLKCVHIQSHLKNNNFGRGSLVPGLIFVFFFIGTCYFTYFLTEDVRILFLCLWIEIKRKEVNLDPEFFASEKVSLLLAKKDKSYLSSLGHQFKTWCCLVLTEAFHAGISVLKDLFTCLSDKYFGDCFSLLLTNPA